MAVQNAAASLTGSATLTPTSAVFAAAHASFAGLAALTAAAEKQEHGTTVSMVGTGVFFIDPTKVLLIPFFRPQSVPAAYKASTTAVVQPQTPGGLPSSVTVGVTRKPPNSQTGGVPNEG